MQISNLSQSEELEREVNAFFACWNDPSPHVTTYTSGSTGIPKQIALSKRHMEASAQMTGNYFGFEPGQTIALSLSPATIGGKMILVRAWLFDMHLVLLPLRRNPLEHLIEEIDFIALVPMQLREILAHSPEKLTLVKTVLLGGAPVTHDLEQKIQGLSTRFFESFGMTETMSHIAVRSLNQPLRSYFDCMKQVQVATDEDGCLRIDAPHLGVHQLSTTDQVEVLSNHQFRWLGRKDFVINSGGYKFHPELLEAKVSDLITGRFFFFGEDDSEFGQRVALAIESPAGDELVLRDRLATQLDRYEMPKRIYFLPIFVETPSGKINRKQSIERIHG